MKDERDAQDGLNQDEHGGEVKSERTPLDRIFTHPPVVVTGGGSIDMEFDCLPGEHPGCNQIHYMPDNVNRPARYSAPGLRIGTVTVVVRGSTHICSHVTPNSTVVIQGTKDQFDHEEITLAGGSGITISFDHDEYRPTGPNQGRKRFRSADRNITALTISNGGSVMHRCPAIPGDGRCEIKITELHPGHHDRLSGREEE